VPLLRHVVPSVEFYQYNLKSLLSKTIVFDIGSGSFGTENGHKPAKFWNLKSALNFFLK
jgi:hypothetical protein